MKPCFNLVFTLLIISNLHSQEESKKYLKLKKGYNYAQGYILHKDSTKEQGLIRDYLMNESKKYAFVNFVHKNGRKVKYNPYQLLGYGYSNYNLISDENNFYEEVSKGKQVTLFKKIVNSSWSTPSMGPGMAPMVYASSNEYFYVKKPFEKEFKDVRKKNFKEEFSKYFSDCPDLVEDIISEKLTEKDIKTIVRIYNYCN